MESVTCGLARRNSRCCAPSPQSAGNGEYMLNQGSMIAVIFFLLVAIAATRSSHRRAAGTGISDRAAVGRNGETSCLGGLPEQEPHLGCDSNACINDWKGFESR
jgi:hypothetical protein